MTEKFEYPKHPGIIFREYLEKKKISLEEAREKLGVGSSVNKIKNFDRFLVGETVKHENFVTKINKVYTILNFSFNESLHAKFEEYRKYPSFGFREPTRLDCKLIEEFTDVWRPTHSFSSEVLLSEVLRIVEEQKLSVENVKLDVQSEYEFQSSEILLMVAVKEKNLYYKQQMKQNEVYEARYKRDKEIYDLLKPVVEQYDKELEAAKKIERENQERKEFERLQKKFGAK